MVQVMHGSRLCVNILDVVTILLLTDARRVVAGGTFVVSEPART